MWLEWVVFGLITGGCACVVSASLAYDAGHERGYEQAQQIYLGWIKKIP